MYKHSIVIIFPSDNSTYLEKIIIALENGLDKTVDREKFNSKRTPYDQFELVRWMVSSNRKALEIKRGFLIYLKEEQISCVRIIIDGIRISYSERFLKYIGIGVGFGGTASGVMAIIGYLWPP